MLDNASPPLYDALHVSDTTSTWEAGDADDVTRTWAQRRTSLWPDEIPTHASQRVCLPDNGGGRDEEAAHRGNLLGLVGFVGAQDVIMKVTLVKPDALMWKDNPAVPKGAQVAVMLGDPSKAGEMIVQRV